jgi:hypothetical protein
MGIKSPTPWVAKENPTYFIFYPLFLRQFFQLEFCSLGCFDPGLFGCVKESSFFAKRCPDRFPKEVGSTDG